MNWLVSFENANPILLGLIIGCLIYYDVDGDIDVNKEKDSFIEKIGEECEKEGIPFILEILTYNQYETEEYTKPRKVINP